MPENLALENLAIVTAVEHRSVDPLRHRNHSFLVVSNSKSNSGPEAAIPNLQNKILFGC
jgi:hypothetical protein